MVGWAGSGGGDAWVPAPKTCGVECVPGGVSALGSYEDDPPYTDGCTDWGHRAEARHYPTECAECGGGMRNVGVSREQ